MSKYPPPGISPPPPPTNPNNYPRPCEGHDPNYPTPRLSERFAREGREQKGEPNVPAVTAFDEACGVATATGPREASPGSGGRLRSSHALKVCWRTHGAGVGGGCFTLHNPLSRLFLLRPFRRRGGILGFFPKSLWLSFLISFVHMCIDSFISVWLADMLVSAPLHRSNSTEQTTTCI
jgi:hypothetical protein